MAVNGASRDADNGRLPSLCVCERAITRSSKLVEWVGYCDRRALGRDPNLTKGTVFSTNLALI